SIRASASGVHGGPAGGAAAPSLTVAANGQPGPAAAAPSPAAPANAAGRGRASALRSCSNGCAGPAGAPTLTPRLFTICVSNGLVSIATRKPHSGQREVALREASSGPGGSW